MQDPREIGPKIPEDGDASQSGPGLSSRMTPKPDHGEATYLGKGLLAGRRALVTGGDSGIGRAVAIAYAREGADVAIAFLPEEREDADETARWIEAAGRKAVLVPGDLSTEAACESLIRDAVEGLGGLDILVNNAAAQVTNDMLEMRRDEIEHTFRVNVYAPIHLCRAALPHLAPGASIINTTSVQAQIATESMLVYAATKGALVSLTTALSNLLAPKGIRVNCVAPGPIWTPFQPAAKEPEQLAELGKKTLLGRPGQPAELAPAFVLLASDQGSYMSGALIPVTGGEPMA